MVLVLAVLEQYSCPIEVHQTLKNVYCKVCEAVWFLFGLSERNAIKDDAITRRLSLEFANQIKFFKVKMKAAFVVLSLLVVVAVADDRVRRLWINVS